MLIDMDSNVVCSRCISDTSIPGIEFDENGVCNFCRIHDELVKQFPLDESGQQMMDQLVATIKKSGRKKKYDCVVGVSGGRDSTYTLYLAKNLGLRPLAVHFDNGWNSEIAVSNIKKATKVLDVDLYTVAADWEQFKDLQQSFLKASVSDAEIPTDYVIISVLFQTADKMGIKYILNGHSFRTEGVVPLSWTYMDDRYIRSVHKLYGTAKLTSFPIMSLFKLVYYVLIKGIKYVPLLQYVNYRQKEAGDIIRKAVGWQYYGGHHYESIYTRFFQSYLLPYKFNIDKRILEYSALIRSDQMTRSAALEEIESTCSRYDQKLVNYTVSKLGLTDEEFRDICTAPLKTFRDFPTYYDIIKIFRMPIKLACRYNLLPHIFYEKYLGSK